VDFMGDFAIFEIGSAIFNADHGHLADAISMLDQAGIDFFHWDVFDGHFIPDLGFSPRTINDVRHLTKKPFTVHLAANNPESFILPLVKSGVDLIYIPVESESMLYEAILRVKDAGIQVGVSLAVGTPVNRISSILPFVDGVMVLGRVYGETVSKTSFLPQALEKIKELKELAIGKNYSYKIEAAGSLTIETAILALKAGADSMAFGKTIHAAEDPVNKILEIRSALQKGFQA